MKNANDHYCLGKWLIENQIVMKLRNHKPADSNMTRRSIVDTAPKFGVLRK